MDNIIKEKIADLNKRAQKLWVKDGWEDHVIAVCLFSSPDENIHQGWFSHWNYKSVVPSHFDSFIAEGKDIVQVLLILEGYLEIAEDVSLDLIKEGERIAEENGFTD